MRALLFALVSSFKDKPLDRDLVVFGEVGLAGEIRPVASGQERLREAAKHGFKRAVVPAANSTKEKLPGMEVIPVKKIQPEASGAKRGTQIIGKGFLQGSGNCKAFYCAHAYDENGILQALDGLAATKISTIGKTNDLTGE